MVGQQASFWLHAVDGIVKVMIGWRPGRSVRLVRIVDMRNLRLQIGDTSAIVEEYGAYDRSKEA